MAFSGRSSASRSGFVLEIPEHVLPADEIIEIEVATSSPGYRRTRLGRFLSAGPNIVERLFSAPASNIVGPFPKPVADAVASLWPDACIDLRTVQGQRAFLARVQTILLTQELRSSPVIADYVRYLRTCWTHCRFVDSFFPAQNAAVVNNAADFHCKPNSIFEIFAIIHQLYVLRSYGVSGDFGEFGCFKGFSYAMLSFSCRQLGLRMHIFDSFEGLPDAQDSTYEAGQYCGSLDEVRGNVTRFGAVDCVEFRKGFFADTFKTYRPPQLLCLWMDVDLEVSARDLMVVADKVHPRATLFSHESTADMFCEDGKIETSAHPDNSIPPMLERFEQMGRPLEGRFVRGNTGAFWPKQDGIPALDNAALLDLMKAVNAA